MCFFSFAVVNAVAADDITAKVASCAACHGANGVSPNDDWPNLAAQQVDYLHDQLKLFRDGKRQNALMPSSLLASFSDADLRDIAEHYNQMPPVKLAKTVFNKDGKNTRAKCLSCHGINGVTVTSVWPNLAGQKAGYTAAQLRAYKDGSRVNPVMQVIASELRDKEIQDVAEYYSQVDSSE